LELLPALPEVLPGLLVSREGEVGDGGALVVEAKTADGEIAAPNECPRGVGSAEEEELGVEDERCLGLIEDGYRVCRLGKELECFPGRDLGVDSHDDFHTAASSLEALDVREQACYASCAGIGYSEGGEVEGTVLKGLPKLVKSPVLPHRGRRRVK
jgi:hypothetical protein